MLLSAAEGSKGSGGTPGIGLVSPENPNRGSCPIFPAGQCLLSGLSASSGWRLPRDMPPPWRGLGSPFLSTTGLHPWLLYAASCRGSGASFPSPSPLPQTCLERAVAHGVLGSPGASDVCGFYAQSQLAHGFLADYHEGRFWAGQTSDSEARPAADELLVGTRCSKSKSRRKAT